MQGLSKLGWLAAVCGLWFCPGCSQAPPPLPDTVPFSGSVELDGKPMDGGMVTFLSKTEKGVNATGIVNENGEYSLKVSVGKAEKEGALPGDYKVTISRFVLPSGKPQDLSKPVEVPGRESLPPKYSVPNQTVLTATVKSGGSADFQLKAK